MSGDFRGVNSGQLKTLGVNRPLNPSAKHQERVGEQSIKSVWELAAQQHGVVARRQLLELGFTHDSIKHRIKRGRLHPVARGVYALGRAELTQYGRWMAAVLSCGPRAVLSHSSAAALWGIHRIENQRIHICVPAVVARRRSGIVVHRRATLPAADMTRHCGIPVTTPICTLIDLAICFGRSQLERAVNEADKRDIASPEELRLALDDTQRRRGVAELRQLLDERTFVLTDSELERRFLPIARQIGLPPPETGCWVNGFKVDFYWPTLGLVVEADGLRYHRTAAQQARDRIRDQAHIRTGLTPLRFTHAQVRYEPDYVRSTLLVVVRRLRERTRLC